MPEKLLLFLGEECKIGEPKMEGTQDIDVEHTKRMVDAFIEAGGKYFDTAYVYTGSEA